MGTSSAQRAGAKTPDKDHLEDLLALPLDVQGQIVNKYSLDQLFSILRVALKKARQGVKTKDFVGLLKNKKEAVFAKFEDDISNKLLTKENKKFFAILKHNVYANSPPKLIKFNKEDFSKAQKEGQIKADFLKYIALKENRRGGKVGDWLVYNIEEPRSTFYKCCGFIISNDTPDGVFDIANFKTAKINIWINSPPKSSSFSTSSSSSNETIIIVPIVPLEIVPNLVSARNNLINVFSQEVVALQKQKYPYVAFDRNIKDRDVKKAFMAVYRPDDPSESSPIISSATSGRSSSNSGRRLKSCVYIDGFNRWAESESNYQFNEEWEKL